MYEKECNANYEFFKKNLDKWIKENKENKIVLLRKKQVIGFFSTFEIAFQEGEAQFGSEYFSIQKITKEIINLGFYSLNLNRKNA